MSGRAVETGDGGGAGVLARRAADRRRRLGERARRPRFARHARGGATGAAVLAGAAALRVEKTCESTVKRTVRI